MDPYGLPSVFMGTDMKNAPCSAQSSRALSIYSVGRAPNAGDQRWDYEAVVCQVALCVRRLMRAGSARLYACRDSKSERASTVLRVPTHH